jgi:hypothetical protein
MDLDFTVPGAFDTSRSRACCAGEIRRRTAQSRPHRLRPRCVRRLPPALTEAAAMYAAGQELDAMRRLEAAIKSNEDLGDAAMRAWGCLFELLQALGRRPAFDALALTFARRFEKSPPTWSRWSKVRKPGRETTGGRAHVSLSGVLNAGIGEVLKQAMKLAATSTLVRMDLAKLDRRRQQRRDAADARPRRAEAGEEGNVFGSPDHLAQILAAEAGGRVSAAMRIDVAAAAGTASAGLSSGCLRGGRGELRDDLRGFAAVLGGATAAGRGTPQASSASRKRPRVSSCADRCWASTSAQFAPLETALAGAMSSISTPTTWCASTAQREGPARGPERLHAAGKKLRLIGLSTLVAAYLEALGFDDVAELRARAI